MANEKLEPRLAALIDQQKMRAPARGLTAAAIEDEAIEVTISHYEDLQAGEGERSEELQALGNKIQKSQGPILKILRRLNIKEPTVHGLTNAVTAKLTPKQLTTGSSRRPAPSLG